MTEKDLWGHFREWGHVQEVFISKHRNKGGRKYGFVRFSGVTDVRRLERQLDNLIISGMKLYVNVPKYERRKSSSEESKTAPKLRSAGGQQANVANRAPRQQPMQHGTLQSGLSWKCWWVALTWSIWQHRNRIVFLNEAFNGSKLMDDAIFLVWSWFSLCGLVIFVMWRRNDDGSYVVLFRSREHENFGPQLGCVRAHIEIFFMVLFFLKPRNGRPRTQVQHLMQIDLKEGWGVGYLSSFQQYCVRQMLNSVAGLREWFAQSDERNAHPRIPVMVNLSSTAVSSKKNQKPNDFSINPTSLDQMNATSRSSALIDEYFDDEEDFQIAEPEQEVAYQIGLENDVRKTALEEEPAHEIDFSSFSGNLRRDDRDNARDCWKISDGNNFKVRSKHYCYEKTKKVPAGKHMLDLVAVDWFIDSKRMDHVARRHGCAAQVASEKGFFSIVLNLQVSSFLHHFGFDMEHPSSGSVEVEVGEDILSKGTVKRQSIGFVLRVMEKGCRK
ncbi:Protein ENHANCED DISEASE RESISTANCE 2 [Glycine max]|nr:Protein ENHANCED DISEASE RESISTANCE 2 [Glycine max]